MGWASRNVVSSTRVSVRRVARCTAVAAVIQLYFGKFQIPVTILIPDKFVDFPCRNIKAVIAISLLDRISASCKRLMIHLSASEYSNAGTSLIRINRH